MIERRPSLFLRPGWCAVLASAPLAAHAHGQEVLAMAYAQGAVVVVCLLLAWCVRPLRAARWLAALGCAAGVVVAVEVAVEAVPVEDVWGIGRRWSAMLEERCIYTALDLANAQDAWVRQRMGIVGLRTVHELRGLVCHAIDDQPAPRQTTCCSCCSNS